MNEDFSYFVIMFNYFYRCRDVQFLQGDISVVHFQESSNIHLLKWDTVLSKLIFCLRIQARGQMAMKLKMNKVTRIWQIEKGNFQFKSYLILNNRNKFTKLIFIKMINKELIIYYYDFLCKLMFIIDIINIVCYNWENFFKLLWVLYFISDTIKSTNFVPRTSWIQSSTGEISTSKFPSIR